MQAQIAKSFLACTALIAATQNVYAHHSNAPHFDSAVEVSNEVIVTDWKFVNPHAYIFFDVVEDDNSKTAWRCETSAATALKRRGFTEETFVEGQKLTIVGNPARREDNVCFVTSFEFEDGTLIGRNGVIPAEKQVGNESVTESVVASAERSATLDNGQPNISGYWVRAGRGGPPGGRAMGGGAAMGGAAMAMGGGGRAAPQVALTDAGQAALDSYVQIYDDPGIHCDIANIFFGWGHDSHVNEIRQEGDKVILQYGYMDYVRTIHLDLTEHPENITPTRGGHSIGSWQNDVLVVDTVGFTSGVLHPIAGIPHSDQMHAIERFSYDAEANTLNRSYVATDPSYHTEPWTGQDSQILSSEPYEPYNCTELSGDNNKRPEDRTGD